ncbi:hypothetical protein AUJ95_05370 [Candidatus Desantisbacteria bacterium CG2_30_40_21]|uniref:Uncharacterized protein n=1 Tax=Candidatus Desantisbacteria bacterium CG2_30_40_21 TaxID=1817895 RepID=A0A1J5DVY6_9BACT|nr:MAG: hypothetical protein AUJ95_05370 [Candidatus Desantisbacteria bacterium CG2_30_40_21]
MPIIQMVVVVASNEKERETLFDFFANKAKEMSTKLVTMVTIERKLKRIIINERSAVSKNYNIKTNEMFLQFTLSSLGTWGRL